MKLAPVEKCTCCMACIDSCKHQALGYKLDSDGYWVITVNKTLCVDCGLCSHVCPVLQPPHHNNHESIPLAGWNQQLDQRKLSASGGVFAAMATQILSNGGVVYGAGIDKFDVKHFRINSIENLPLLQGSKYQHGISAGIYNKVKSGLLQGKTVLFSGLGCQIGGLIKFLGNVSKENLYTIDNICGGVSTMLPMLHLKKSGKYASIISFRDKDSGWKSSDFKYNLKMRNNNGEIENLGDDNFPIRTFSSPLLKRASCLECQFCGNNRISDCTIGDLWGDSKYKEQHDNGLSVLIIHNRKIEKILAASSVFVERISFNDFIPFNPNYMGINHGYIKHFFFRSQFFKFWKWNISSMSSYILKWNSIPNILLRIYLRINKHKSI